MLQKEKENGQSPPMLTHETTQKTNPRRDAML